MGNRNVTVDPQKHRYDVGEGVIIVERSFTNEKSLIDIFAEKLARDMSYDIGLNLGADCDKLLK